MNNLNLIKREMYDIERMYKYIESTEDLDQETIDGTKESIETLIESNSEQLGLILIEQEQDIEKAKNISKFFAEKAKYLEEKQKGLKSFIKEKMLAMDLKQVKTDSVTFSIRNNAPSVIIDNEEEVPGKFKEIIQTEKIKKIEIKNAIKNGEEVAGAHLESSQSLIMK